MLLDPGSAEDAPGMAKVDILQGRPGDRHRGDRRSRRIQSVEHRRHRARRVVGPSANGRAVDGDLTEPRHAIECFPDRAIGDRREPKLDRVAAQLTLETFWRAFRDDPAPVEDRQPLGKLIRFFHVMGREQDRQTLLAGEAADLRPHLGTDLRIEPGCRLVEEEHLRAMDERHRDRQPALHATGPCADHAVGGPGEPEAVEQGVDPLGELTATHAVDRALERQVLAAGGLPVDLAHNLPYVSGSAHWAGVIPALIVAYQRAYGFDPDTFLSDRGRQVVGQVESNCIGNFASDYPGLTDAEMVRAPYTSLLDVPEVVAAIDDNIMGSAGTPAVPVLLAVGNVDGTGDSVMIADDVEGLAREYCDRGVAVSYDEYAGRNHADAFFPFQAQAAQFLTERFAGLAAGSDCDAVGPGNELTPTPVP